MMRRQGRSADPPRLAERILEAVIQNPIARAGLVGDLREAFHRRRLTGGWFVCALWYWWQTLYAGARYGIEQLRKARRTRVISPRRQHHSFTHREHRFMAGIVQDLHYAIRVLVKSPAIAAMAIVALTLGIGLPTIMFTVVNGVFRDLPVEQPDRVLRLYTTHIERGGDRWVSHHDYADWRAQLTSFDGLAGFSVEDVTLSGGDARPLRRNAAFVTDNAFAVLRTRPEIGRAFDEDDAIPGAPPVAVVSYGIWQSRFAGDPDVVGRELTVDGVVHTVIGVMPQRFGFPENEHLWMPLMLSLEVSRADSPELQVFGRLRDGVSLRQAQSELRAVAAQLADAFPETNHEQSAGAAPYSAGLMDSAFARGLYTMLGAVSFVLLIACVNVANLFLARAISRSREIAVRTALGASRTRVISQFFVESFIVAAVGGVLGTIVAWIGVRLFNQAVTSFVGLAWVDIRIDLAVLGFVIGLVLLGSLLAGLLPALQASTVNVNDALKDAPRGGASLGFRIGRFGRGLVVAEIALSCALLVVSGLLIKGVLKLKAIDLGLPAEEIVTGEVELPRQVYTTPESRVRFFEEFEAITRSIPGVRSVAMMSDIPGTIGYRLPIAVSEQPAADEQIVRAGILTVTPAFVDVLGVQIIDGRGFASYDRTGTEPVAIVNQSLAEALFPDRRSVGQTVQVGRLRRTIVGLVPDLLMGNVNQRRANGPGMYIPFAQTANVSMQVMVRTAQDPLTVIDEVRSALESLDPTLAMMDVDRVDHLISAETAIFEVFARLFLFFGMVALLLASIGLYGVMMFMVRQRTREWGIRIALGATAAKIVGLAAKQAGVQLAVGLTLGSLIAGMLSMPLANFFYQVEPWDWTILAAIAVLLSITAVIASFVPARRAARVDPLESLRYE